MKNLFIFLLTILAITTSNAQTKWYNPQTEKTPIHGQIMPLEERTNYYQRLPDAEKANVREPLWFLSRHAAGESLKFTTNASRITIRYSVTDVFAYNHIPATGKSGLDLYSLDSEGIEKRHATSRYSFADTVMFTYYLSGESLEYELYLPSYNDVEWLEIGVKEDASFEFVEPSEELPIVVYGTSIAQGACASRPGMIWTTILKRELRMPVMNIGFSGNGKLEPAMTNIIKQVPARLIILDCLPNISNYHKDTIVKLTIAAVKNIRSAQPTVPIILADHLQPVANNKANVEAMEALEEMGYKNLYHLTYDELAMPTDGFVDWIHPSDYGMRVYADAYKKKINEALGN